LAQIQKKSDINSTRNVSEIHRQTGVEYLKISNLNMGKLKIKGGDLTKLGFPKGSKVTSMTLDLMHRHYKHNNKAFVLNMLKQLIKNPKKFIPHEVLESIAELLIEKPEVENIEVGEEIRLLRDDEIKSFKKYGSQYIGQGAIDQMNIAMRLPVTVKGALMADAHQGYGLPIGGVLATQNCVIPYGVGVDIGCRMSLSIYEAKASYLVNNDFQLKGLIKENARFGRHIFEDRNRNDAIFERSEFKDIKILKKLRNKAYQQIGSSGGGNHFVEFGIVKITDIDNEFGLQIGEYMGLLTHSGSRALGANIARHYTNIAQELCYLPKQAQHLAWLNLDSEPGQEYWAAMNLAGDYASACHHHIHRRMMKSLGMEVVATVENHHNFAWKEHLENGEEVIVHRKGATPAGKGVLGIIPGSMTAPGFIVRGTGNPLSLNSASHGAGRQMSRTKAKANLNMKMLKQELSKNKVTLFGGGLDEAPQAYKNIHDVMAAQQDLVEVIGRFLPKIVRMDK
jgi:tRNA-splicing ligase RtcB